MKGTVSQLTGHRPASPDNNSSEPRLIISGQKFCEFVIEGLIIAFIESKRKGTIVEKMTKEEVFHEDKAQ